MSLSKKTLLLLFVVLSFTVIISAILSQSLFMQSYLDLENQDILSDIARLQYTLEHEIENLSVLTNDWAAWDDSYDFMLDANPDFINSNLGQNTLENLDLNFMIYWNTDLQVHFFNYKPTDDKTGKNHQVEIGKFFINHPGLIVSDNMEEQQSGIVSIQNKPYLIASMPILTSQDEGPARGRLIFGKLFSGELLEHLQMMTSQKITMNLLTEKDLEEAILLPGDQLSDPENITIEKINSELVQATIFIRDLTNQPVLALTIEKPRTIILQGQQSMLRLVFSLVATGIISSLSVLFILNQQVISRLLKLNKTVHEIQADGYQGQTLALPGGDEISSLSKEIENAFQELARVQTDINKYLDVQRVLFKISNEFINVPIDEIDAHINAALKTIGELSGADRSYLFIRREEQPHIIDNTHEWCRKGIAPMQKILQGIPQSSLPWWFKNLNQGKTIIIPSVDDLPDKARAERELLQSQSIQSLAVIPMFISGQLIGFVGFDAVRNPKVFSERSISLLGIMSGMIANAIDRKQKERRLALSQHVQYKLNEITRISIQKSDLHATAQELSRGITELVNSDLGIILLRAIDGSFDSYLSGRSADLPEIQSEEFMSFIRSQNEYIYIHTGHDETDTPTMLGSHGVNAYIIIPLISGKELLGAAILADKSPRLYSPEEAAICQQAGPQITLSIMKVKALEAAHRRSNEMEALRATITDMTSELQLEKLLRTALERAIRLAHADGGEVCVFDEEKQALRVVACHNLDQDYTGTFMSLGKGAGGKAVALKKTIIIKDYDTWPGRMKAYAGVRIHATIVSPLMIGERVLGTISILHFNKQNRFSKNDQYILSMFAQHAAIALDNALLFEQVQKLARTDAVTGLYNRRAMREIGEYEIRRAKRLDLPIAVAMIDLDDFKVINDQFSHQTGDEVLKEVARLLRENIRNIDTISRYGGDEFVIIMPATNLQESRQAAARLKHILESTPIGHGGNQFSITASIGLSAHDTNPPDLDEMLRQADEAMYKVKTSGKNRIGFFQPGGFEKQEKQS